MKKIILILVLFFCQIIQSQVLKNYVFNSIDAFIEIETKYFPKNKDSLILQVDYQKKGSLQISFHKIKYIGYLKDEYLDSIYLYKGYKTIINIDDNQLKKCFKLLNRNNQLEKLFSKYKFIEQPGTLTKTYSSLCYIAFQFNKKGEIYYIENIIGKEFYNKLKGKVKFSKKLKFIPSLKEQNEIKLSQ